MDSSVHYRSDVAHIRVVIVEDEALIRHALAHVISESSDVVVVGSFTSDCRLGAVEGVDVAVLSFSDLDSRTLARIAELRTRAPSVHILGLIGQAARDEAILAIQAGATGCVSRNSDPNEFIAAVRRVASGDHVFCSRTLRQVVDKIRSLGDAVRPRDPGPSERLTERESSVVMLLGQGLSNREISREMHLAESTIKTHLGRVMKKWNARDRVQVLVRALQYGVVQPR